jgi:hypothetical protein
MWFINPMWDNEAERIGKLTCTPLGYRLHVISDLIGFAGLLSLVACAGFLIFRGIAGTFYPNLLWVLAVPVVLRLIGSALFDFSWRLARRRGFEYDGESRTASWLEDGHRRTFNYARDKGKTHAESGRGDGIAPVTPPTPPGMRVRTGRFR